MVELTMAHAEIWKSSIAKLLFVTSQVAVNKNFEDGTRRSAVEIVLSLSQEMPAPLRKAEEMKTQFFPTLVSMLEEVEEDNETWVDFTEEDEISATGPANTATDAIRRLGLDLGEKTTIAIAQPLVAANIAKENWQAK
jgi:importin-5